MNNDSHNQILDAYFWRFVDRGDAPADTTLFTGHSRPRAALSDYRAGIRPSAARGGIRHRDRPEGGRAMNRDIYEAITARFIEQLKRGTVPWQKPWFGVQNIVSRKPYRGINALLLGSTDYQSPFWISFRQALDLGGHVKKGEKSTPVIYYKILEKRDEAGKIVLREDGRPARIPFVRWANVFNLDQTEGIPAPAITANQGMSPPHEKAAAIVENARLCPIHHAGFAAFYSPQDDVIRIPAPSTFHSQEDYYHTLYHELTHASGPFYPSGPGGDRAASEIWFRAVLQGGAGRRTRRGVPVERGGHSGLGPVRELGGLPWIVDQEARKRSPVDRLRGVAGAARPAISCWESSTRNRSRNARHRPKGMPLTWAREHGIDTRIPGFAHRDQDGDGVSTLMEWKHGTRPIDRLSQPRGHSL